MIKTSETIDVGWYWVERPVGINSTAASLFVDYVSLKVGKLYCRNELVTRLIEKDWRFQPVKLPINE